VKRKNKYLRIQTITGVLYSQLPVFLPDQLKLPVPIHLTILKKAVSRRLSFVGAGLKIIKKHKREPWMNER
jgi:hypothetical protein